VLKLRQVTVRPPHFVLVVRGQAKPVAPGQNNLFAAIVLFVHTVATHHLGRLLYAPRLRLRRATRSRRRADEDACRVGVATGRCSNTDLTTPPLRLTRILSTSADMD